MVNPAKFLEKTLDKSMPGLIEYLQLIGRNLDKQLEIENEILLELKKLNEKTN